MAKLRSNHIWFWSRGDEFGIAGEGDGISGGFAMSNLECGAEDAGFDVGGFVVLLGFVFAGEERLEVAERAGCLGGDEEVGCCDEGVASAVCDGE